MGTSNAWVLNDISFTFLTDPQVKIILHERAIIPLEMYRSSHTLKDNDTENYILEEATSIRYWGTSCYDSVWNAVKLGYKAMKENVASLQRSGVLTEEYKRMINSEELINTTKYMTH